MSAIAAQEGPRVRVLGSEGAYTKFGLDGQEAALRSGQRPTPDGAWGEEPAGRWGRLGAGDELLPVPTEPGAWPRFYEGVVATIRHGAPPPVDPEDAVAGLELIEAARRSASEGKVVVVG